MKRVISAILIALLAFGLYNNASVQKTTEVVSGVMAASTAEPLFVYNVSIVSENTDEDDDELTAEHAEIRETYVTGFKDALSDYLGDSAIIYFRQSAKEAVENNVDLIFTTDETSLLAASTETDLIPIVSTGVIDVQGTLRIADTSGKSWDQTTGRNITGVSSRPSISDQLSLLIEATPDLQAVGLFFDVRDSDSIYQNEIMENYLDQAGIPWKEYEISSGDDDLNVESDETEDISLVPNKQVAASAKEGVNNDVISLGENELSLGIISESSTRTARTSKFWTGGKQTATTGLTAEDAATTEKANDDDSTASENATEAEEYILPEDASLDEIVSYACSQCSVLFIPSGSNLTSEMAAIGNIATEQGVSTVGGDAIIGQHTLVCSYQDPYEQGYAAGKKAVSILQNQTDPGTIKVSTGNVDYFQKLYNGDIAEKLGMTFPKSFSEINEYFVTYEPGAVVERHNSADE